MSSTSLKLVRSKGRPRALSDDELRVVVDRVSEKPPKHGARIAKELGKPAQTVRDAIHRLAGPFTPEESAIVLEMLAANPGVSDAEIADRLIRPLVVVSELVPSLRQEATEQP